MWPACSYFVCFQTMDLDDDPETLINTLLEVVLSDPSQLDEAVPQVEHETYPTSDDATLNIHPLFSCCFQVCALAGDDRVGARRGAARFLEASCAAEPPHWSGACAALASLLSDPDETTARRACIASGTIIRGAFAHVVAQPLTEVAGLRKQVSDTFFLYQR